MKEEEKISMGIGPIGKEIVFPRTFRFLLIPKKNPELQYFISKASINYYRKSIDLSIYERCHLQTHDWIVDMLDSGHKDDFTLISLDGLGEKMYILEFSGAKLAGHNVGYDYAKSDVVTHNISFDYLEMKKLPNVYAGYPVNKNSVNDC